MNPEDFDERGVPLSQAMWQLYEADQRRVKQRERNEQAERLHAMGLTRLADQFAHWSQPTLPEDLDHGNDGMDNTRQG